MRKIPLQVAEKSTGQAAELLKNGQHNSQCPPIFKTHPDPTILSVVDSSTQILYETVLYAIFRNESLRDNINAAKTLVIILIVFFVCWFPFFLTYILSFVGKVSLKFLKSKDDLFRSNDCRMFDQLSRHLRSIAFIPLTTRTLIIQQI